MEYWQWFLLSGRVTGFVVLLCLLQRMMQVVLSGHVPSYSNEFLTLLFLFPAIAFILYFGMWFIEMSLFVYFID